MSDNRISITLTTIRCIESSESEDEVYIQYSLDGGPMNRFPASGSHPMKDGSVWNNVNLQLVFSSTVKIELWDNDSALSPNDLLGSHTYAATDVQPRTEAFSHTARGGDTYMVTTEPS